MLQYPQSFNHQFVTPLDTAIPIPSVPFIYPTGSLAIELQDIIAEAATKQSTEQVLKAFEAMLSILMHSKKPRTTMVALCLVVHYDVILQEVFNSNRPQIIADRLGISYQSLYRCMARVRKQYGIRYARMGSRGTINGNELGNE